MTTPPKSVAQYLATIGAKGGAAKTKAKASSAKANGKKGGRPAGVKDSKPRVRLSVEEADAERVALAKKDGWTKIDWNAAGQRIGLAPRAKAPWSFEEIPSLTELRRLFTST